ncbi:MAG: hypothetical protein ACJA0Q_000191 [Saprospiraceae bacterium]|jgi:hypothetical protein
MENLFLQSTTCSPEIEFSPKNNIFKITGESCMSDANLFYAPVLAWLRAYGSNENSGAQFKFHFSAVSQSSMKMLLFVCQEIKSMQIDGSEVHVSWCFSNEKPELKEIGQDISYMTDLDFDYVLLEILELV